MVVCGGAANHVHAAAGGFHAAQTAADGDGLAGDHAGGGAAVVHGVGVHHPGHGLRVGVDIGSGNILVRPDDHANFAGVAARNALELCTGVVARVDADAAFGTPERQVDRCGLDGHPGRQRHDFRQRDVLVVAHAALAGAARYIVLHAIPFEVGDGAVIQLDRNVDDQHALGSLECFHPFAEPAQVG